jgi:hypothetical protein
MTRITLLWNHYSYYYHSMVSPAHRGINRYILVVRTTNIFPLIAGKAVWLDFVGRVNLIIDKFVYLFDVF